MDVDELSTIQFLDLIWGEENCYVDLPSKAGGHWMPWYCEWPADRPLVRRRIESCQEDREDIYFSVARFRSRGRRLVDVLPTRWCWADLDRIDPVFLDEDGVLPTMAWESSPGRYQCVWRLTTELEGERQTKLNRRLTNAIGADKGGYDLTQVLRPIETWNFKYSPPADVELLWHDESLAYSPRQLVAAVKEMEKEDGRSREAYRSTQASGAGVQGIPRLPARARRLLRTPPEMVVVGERSARLWELEKLLAEAGLDGDQIFGLVWPCAWNKHREVRTGEEQLRREIAKAVASTAHKVERKGQVPSETPEPDGDGDLHLATVRVTSPFVDYATFLSTNIETPRWGIENIWTASSHGIIGGEPKTGKTTFALAMALSMATGRPFLGQSEYHVASPGPVLFIQEENAPWAIQDKLRKLAHMYGILRKGDVEISEAPTGSIVEHIVRLDFPDEAPLRLLNNYGFTLVDEEDLGLLENEIRREGIAMVIIDPLYMVMADTNLNNSHDVGPILQWLTALHYNHNCAVILIHHWSKATEVTTMRRAGQRLMGSAMFHGWIDSALYMEKLESGDNNVLRVKVEREFRNAPPQGNLEVLWQPGEPGELDMKVSAKGWDLEGQATSVIERMLSGCDERGLNLKAVAQELKFARGKTGNRKAARLAHEIGYPVWRVKYSNGSGYVVYPDGKPGGKFKRNAKLMWNGGSDD